MSKKYILIISIIVLMFSFSGCDYFGPGMADYSYKLSGDYEVYHAGNTNIGKGDKIVVTREVKGVVWDSSYILAKQEKDNEIRYYIISVSNDEIYGPLSEEDFNKKRDELKIDKDLKLKDPSKYRK